MPAQKSTQHGSRLVERIILGPGQLTLSMGLPMLFVVAAAAFHYELSGGQLGGWAMMYAVGGVTLGVLGLVVTGTRKVPMWLAAGALLVLIAGVVALEIDERTAPGVVIAALTGIGLAHTYPKAKPAVPRLERPPAPLRTWSPPEPAPVPAQPSLPVPEAGPAFAPPTVAPPPAPPAVHTVPVVGREQLATFRLAAWVLGVLALLAALGLVAPLYGGVVQNQALQIVATIFFGTPALMAIWALKRQPKDAIIMDSAGIRRSGGKLDWELRWEQLRGIGLSIKITRLPRTSVANLNRRREIGLVFAPADPADFDLPGIREWDKVPGYTRAMPLLDAPFVSADPLVIRKLAVALQQAVPGLYAGIFRDE